MENLSKIFKAAGLNHVDEELVKDVARIIEWQQILKEVNIDGVEPMYNTLGGDAKYISNEDVVAKESAYYQALNRKFIEFQPVFLNAMTMLEMGGKIEKSEVQHFNLTKEGALMAFDLQHEVVGATKEVVQAAFHLNNLLGVRDAKQLYKDFKIML